MTSSEIKTEPVSHNGNNQICRLCMSEESLDDVFKDEQLKEWIWEFLAIKISDDDRMSQVICTICRVRLTEFHQFRMGCHEVQEVLQALIPDGTNGAHSAQTASVQKDPNASNQEQRIVNMDISYPIHCEVCRIVFRDEKQLSNHKRIHETGKFRCSMCETSCTSCERLNNHLQIHTTIGLENQRITHVKTENDQREEQTAASTSKTESEVSSCMIRSESNCDNLDSQKDPLCVGSVAKVESLTHFQEEHIENIPLGIEDCIVVEQFKVETRSDDEVAVGTKKRKTGTDICVDENSSTVSLKRGKDKPSRRKTVNYSDRSESESNESDFDTKVSGSDNADEVEQHSACDNSDEGYKCSKCDQTFNRESRLKSHMTIHEEKESEESSHESSREDEKSASISDNAATSDEDQEEEKIIEQVYQCDTCQKVYPNRTKLSIHMTYHRQKLKKLAALEEVKEVNSEKKDSEQTDSPVNVDKVTGENLQCDVCQKICLTRKILFVHKRNVHGPKRHRCDICDVQYTLRCEMTRHVYTKKHINKVREKQTRELEESSNSEKQGKNKKKTKDSSLLKDHVFAKYRKKGDHIEQAKCAVCDRMFENKWSLANHKKYHKPKKHICHVCEKPCHNSAVLKRHLATHVPIAERQQAKPPPVNTENAPRPYKCDICETAFMKNSSLWKHNLSVHAPKTFVCEICGFKFSSNDMLARHLQTHALRGHTKEDFKAFRKLFEQNDKSANQNDDDEMSDQSSISGENDTNEKGHNCSSKTDDNSSQLTAEHRFQCDVCHKNFDTRVLLYRHKRYVHKAKRFKCSVCSKRFAYRQQRNMHMKIHKPESTATKDFECPECHKIYTSWKSLYQHVKEGHVRNKTLPEDRTFACAKCDKTFQTAQRLGVHTRTVHAPVEHKCDICKKTFSVRVQLWQHMNTQHAKKSTSSKSKDTTDESDFEDSVQENNSSRKRPRRNVKVNEAKNPEPREIVD